VNVAELDDQLFSDTLFVHARGAFTGADKSRKAMVARQGAAHSFCFMRALPGTS